MSDHSTIPQVCVFAPGPMLTITVEQAVDEAGELHVHPGGQGFWVARMLGTLGARAILCSPLGGETGQVLGHLLSDADVELRAIPIAQPSGAYMHDRRDGEREEWWRANLPQLGRHEVDDLFSATLAAALEAGTCVLTGTSRQRDVVPDGTFERLATDLRANGVGVVSDLQGHFLRECLQGGTDLVKISEDELIEDEWASSAEDDEVVAGIERLAEAGARDIVVSRAEGGAIALLGGTLLRATGPKMTPVDPAGAGDSMTAALAFARASGLPATDALRLAVAAGAVNVTRHGLGSGDGDAIRLLAANVEVASMEGGQA